MERRIAEGDLVRVPRRADHDAVYLVLAVDDDVAWLRRASAGGGGYSTERLDELEVCL